MSRTLNLDLSRIGLGLLVIAVAGFAIAAIGLGAGSAAAAEVGNETVEIDNATTDVVVETTWNESLADPANATADVTIANATDGTSVHNLTVDGAEASTIETKINVSDAGLESGTEYRVTVNGSESEIDSVQVGTLGDGGGVVAGVTNGFFANLTGPIHPLVSFGVAAVLLALGVVAYRKDVI